MYKNIPTATFWMNPSYFFPNLKGWDKHPYLEKLNEPNLKHKYFRTAHQHTGSLPEPLL